MKLCIDGLSVSHLYGTGYYSYTYGLLTSLFEIYPQPKYELIWDNDLLIPDWHKYNNIKYTKIDINRKNNNYTLLEEQLRNNKTDLYYSPNNGLSLPKNKICKYIMTAHDLSPVSCSNLVDNKYYNKFINIFPDAVKKADSIIAVSEFIKNEIIKFYKIPDKKIEVIYPGYPNIFKPLDLNTARNILKIRYQIDGNFILYAGSIHSRKNLDILIKALKLMLKDLNDIKLVIVGNCDGKRRNYYLTLKNLVRELGIEEKVVFTGTVKYTDMPYFYNCASCTLNLSNYDGFPITTMEAIACGSPMICLQNSSIEEVTFQTAVILDNLDINFLKNNIMDILRKNEKKNCIQTQFLNQPLKYNWDISAKKLVRILESTIYGVI